jgi:hypothetical protein
MDKNKICIKLVDGKFKIYNKFTHEFCDKDFNSLEEAKKFLEKADLVFESFKSTKIHVKHYNLRNML